MEMIKEIFTSPWEEYASLIDNLLKESTKEYAHDYLRRVRRWIRRHKYVSYKQKVAINHIKKLDACYSGYSYEGEGDFWWVE